MRGGQPVATRDGEAVGIGLTSGIGALVLTYLMLLFVPPSLNLAENSQARQVQKSMLLSEEERGGGEAGEG